MKKVTFVATALVCATIFAAGTASAQIFRKPGAPLSQPQTTWARQAPTPPNPMLRTPVAGYSPNFAAPQPATMELLTRDANRLIRWQGWLDIDAFAVSVTNQMQRQLQSGAIQAGSYTLDEPALAEAVMRASTNPTFVMCEVLKSGGGIQFESTPTLYVWTYRHNFADRGLYQLYISAKGKMYIGTMWDTYTGPPVEHKDIQSLYYEFGNLRPGTIRRQVPVYADVEIWRGAVVFVNHAGALTMAGTQVLDVTADVPGGLVPGVVPPLARLEPVASAPMSDWERAPSLICNPNYDPRRATGAAFVEPLERARSITGNSQQLQAGDVQSRVNTVNPYRFRR